MGAFPGRDRFSRTRIVISALLLGSGLAAASATASGAAASRAPAPASATRTATSSGRAATAESAAPGASGLVRANVAAATGVQPASAAPAGYAPSDLLSAYNLVSAAASGGTGATVAIIGAYDDPNAAADLAVYRAQYGLAPCTVANGCFRELNEDGEASPLPESYLETPDPWATDESLDLDMVSAVCPNCDIVLLETNSPAIIDTGSAVDSAVASGAKYVIIDPLTEGSDLADGKYLDHPGVAITVPAGNYGYRGPDFNYYPAASQFVTTVGGTTLTSAPGTARGWSETVWGPPDFPASDEATSSGCAIGTIAGKPSWQTDTGCTSRTVGDVAAVGNPDTGVAFYDSYEGGAGWGVGGGTTVSAAIVGAVYALAGTPAAGTFPVTYPYLNTADLYPVTSGTNQSAGCTPAYLCTAGPGYNGPAGWGTPDGTGAFTFTSQPADYIALTSPGLQSTVLTLPYNVSIPANLAADSAPGEPLTYAATGLPPGVTFDPATGAITGQVTEAFHGTSTITASDPTGAQATVSFGWKLQNLIELQTPAAPATEPDATASLQIKATDAASGQTLTYAAAGLPPGLSIDPATGLISGTTSSTIATYDVTVTVTDGTGSTASTSFPWNVWNLITVSVPDPEHVEVGVPVSVRATATDSAPGQTITFGVTGAGAALPPGLSLDATTGVISGTPTALGEYTGLIEATDGTGSEGLATFEFVVAGNITVTSPGTLSTRGGQTVNETLPVTDSAANDTLGYAMTGAPPGLLIEPHAPVIYGWPDAPGNYTVTVSVSGLWGGAASASFKWTVTAAADAGPTGPIRLDLGGKCLDDMGNRSTNGNKIQIWSCTGRAPQNWTLAEDGTIRIHGKCLDVFGRSIVSGAKLQLWSCTGGGNQVWSAGFPGTLVNPASGKCLTDTNGTNNGTQLQIQPCGPWYDSQRWTTPAGPALLGIAGKCLDDRGAGTANGNVIQVWQCNGEKSQAWTVDPDSTIRILGKCLTVGGTGAAGSPVELSACSGSPTQWWAPTGIDGIGSELVNDDTNVLCVSDPADSTANGTQLVLGGCDAGDPGTLVHFW
jgi:Ricin-type beta-trefoil lectin domain/Putative Ig domain